MCKAGEKQFTNFISGFILAGLWGAKNFHNRALMKDLGMSMLTSRPRDYWDYDQALLRRIVWPHASKHALQHDAYFCDSHKTCRHKSSHISNTSCHPFPSKRPNNYTYVGWSPVRSNVDTKNGLKKCPKSCRPQNHVDWKYC